MTYADLIKQWYSRATTEKDVFTAYIFLYIAFIAFLSQHESNKNDREKIDNLKADKNASDYYQRITLRDKELEETINELIEELRKDPIKNVTRQNDHHWRGDDGVVESVNDWENLVEFWHRVRNNLFHGHKAPEFDRDKRLVTYAYETLQPLMKNFIDNDLMWAFSE